MSEADFSFEVHKPRIECQGCNLLTWTLEIYLTSLNSQHQFLKNDANGKALIFRSL